MNIKILIVEDDKGIRDAMQIMLEQQNYKVDMYPDGQALLRNDFQIPQLFILDKQLPGVDGLDLCIHLKSLGSTKHIPIVILSASPQSAPLVAEAGANAFLEKPFNRWDLLKLIEDLIRNKHLSIYHKTSAPIAY